METQTVSLHAAKVFAALSAQWATSVEIAQRSEVSLRTARNHLLCMVKEGIADRADLFPSYQYRLSEKGVNRNIAYHQRLVKARRPYGVFLGEFSKGNCYAR